VYKRIKKVLIVGLGSIGSRHLKIISTNYPGLEIVVLRHKDCFKEDNLISNIYRCTNSIDEALKFNPQVAVIANPAPYHIETSKILARKGINLLIEKPISNSSNGVRELLNICQDQKTILMTGYNLRFLPSLIEFKKQINSNKIGKILSVRAEVGQYLPNWRPEVDYRSVVSAKKNMGGGVLLELSHEIDYLKWIFGDISWVQAHLSKQSSLEIDVEDSAHIILGFKKDKNTEIVASLNMDFIRHDTTRKCCVIGDKGTISWDAISGKVSFFSPDSNDWELLFESLPDRNFTYTKEIKSFFDSVEFNKPVSVSGKDGLSVIEIIEAIEKSSCSESKVYL